MKIKVGTGAIGLAVSFVVVFSFSAARAATLDELQKTIEANCAKHTSISFQVECSTIYMTNKSYEITIYEAVQEGGKWKKHTDAKILREVTVGNNSNPMKKTMVLVDDSVFAYVFDDTDGEKSAKKLMSPNVDECKNVEDIFGDIKVGNDLAFLPDEKMLGQDVFVIEAKSAKKKYVGKFYVSQQTGVVLKSEQTFGDDKSIRISITVKDFKLDEPIPADHFVFTPPEGVVVEDRTLKSSK